MLAIRKIINFQNQSTEKSKLDELKDYIEKLKSAPIGNFEEDELEIRKRFKEAEQEVLKDRIQRYDINVPVIHIEGKLYRQVLRGLCQYMTASGTVEVMRSLYRSKEETHSICPFELQAGIVESYWTPTAAKQAVWATAHLTPEESAELFQRVGNMNPSKSSLDRLPKLLADHMEKNLFFYQKTISHDEEIPLDAVTVAVSLDGVMVPMKKQEIIKSSEIEAETINNQYKEASCGTISFYDEDGERLSTLQFGRMPEQKKTTLKNQLSIELEKIFGKNPNLNLIKIADGAKDNWNYLDNVLPIGASLLDFYHMSEHLKEIFDAAYGEGSSKSLAQFEKYKSILKTDYNGAGIVIRAIAYLQKQSPKKKKIKSGLTYFKNNRKRMWYAYALDKNLPIGSGPVEATCKTLVSQRLKRSGMHWTNKGGQAILSFRSLIKSGRFDKAWDLLKNNYIKLIDLPKNVLAFSR
jgi:hypothetical protein